MSQNRYEEKCAEMAQKASGFKNENEVRKREEKREQRIIAELDDIVSEMLEMHKVSVIRLSYKGEMKDGHQEGISEIAIERLKKDARFAVRWYTSMDERLYYEITWNET